MKRFVLVATAVVVAAALAACGPEFPEDDPAIEGEVTGVSIGDERVTILVEVPEDELPPPTSSFTGYDKASVTVTNEALIYDESGDVLPLSALERTGGRVRVWFTGPVAESYPVQATASTVQVMDARE